MAEQRRQRMARTALAAAVAVVAGPGGASAQMCDLRVYDSSFGSVEQEADTQFFRNEQFIICFKPLADGYVSLWDQIPEDGPVERLAPNNQFQAGIAIPVEANKQRCFGDGSDGYYLLMEAKDGLGLGRMWMVYSETPETHPNEDSLASLDMFRNAYERFGAGAIGNDPGASARRTSPPQHGACEPENKLEYYYRVLDENGAG